MGKGWFTSSDSSSVSLVPRLATPLLYPLSPGLRLLHSTDPKNIGVSGDPPLCRACTRLFSRYHILGISGKDNAESILNLPRLQASAKLGCYVCNLLLQSNWKPTGKLRSPMPVTESIEVIGQEVCEINYRISNNNVKDGSKSFHLDATVVNGKSGHMWSLKMILIQENDIEDVERKRLLQTTTLDSIAQLGNSWINTCQESHQECNVNMSSSWRPTRLIYVCGDTAPKPKLCDSLALPQHLRYLTLSHSWGKLEIFKLLTSNIEELTESLPLERLTQLFRDAIELTRRLGIEYIWIDSLCIIQDSTEDWALESATMGDVYKYCWCNISATGFPDGKAGLLVKRDPALVYPQKFNLDIRAAEEQTRKNPWKNPLFDTRTQSQLDLPNICAGQYYLVEDLLRSNISIAPISRRAWVFQERLLSPRILHIEARQVFWECTKLEACETFPSGLPTPLTSRFKATAGVARLSKIFDGASEEMVSEVLDVPRMNALVLSIWGKVKAGYNDKDLTYHTDKVVAISGLARVLQPMMRSPFVAGLWKERLLKDLLWCCPNLIDRPKPRPDKYQAPSWSWLAINEIIHDIPLVEPVTAIVEIMDCQTNVDSPNPTTGFEQITSGFLRARGRLTRASFVDSDKVLREVGRDMFLHQIRLMSSDGQHRIIKPFIWPDNLKPFKVFKDMPIFTLLDAIGSRDFYLLPFCHDIKGWVGHVLEHTGIKGQYRRIASWHLPRKRNQEGLEEYIETFEEYVPMLEEMDYEERGDEGQSTLMII